MTDSPVREALTDSIKYWEPRRLLYNVALGAIVLTYFALNYPGSKLVFSSLSGILLFFILCVLANVAYCAAYAVDLFAQMSGFKERWRKNRWLLLALGTLFAGAITWFFVMGLFSSVPSSLSWKQNPF